VKLCFISEANCSGGVLSLGRFLTIGGKESSRPRFLLCNFCSAASRNWHDVFEEMEMLVSIIPRDSTYFGGAKSLSGTSRVTKGTGCPDSVRKT
jgi:hypothetical protein